LSLVGGGKIYYSSLVLLICLVFTIAAIMADRTIAAKNAEAEVGNDARLDQRNPVKMAFLLQAGLLVLLFSIVNSSGFAFPAADLGQIVNVEFSRLVYAAGLLIAGFVTDQNRKHGAICALTALIIPFIIFSLRGEPIPSAIFWVLSYFTFGFYSVYRVILFSDIAAERNLMYLSGAGLLAGRIGDALGEGICLLLADHAAIRVGLTAILFAASVALFFKLYQVLYIPEAVHQQSEKERFAQFAAVHDLSLREQDMLHLILDKKTNSEIADHLCISENTVKFHVRNLLQKTGCKNRKELLTIFETYRE
jgi:DNA-binding CsgD family transcriptional regulator